MIRFGLNTFLVSSGFTDQDLPLVQEFKRYGADVIELAIVDPAAVSVDTLKTALKENRLEKPVICGAFGGGRDLRGTAEQREDCSEYIRQLIQLASELGADVVCGPFYSETGRSGAHTPEEREAQFEQIADALRPLCKEAESSGIVLAMEPLNRFETDCINTLGQAVEMIERVGSPALKIHIDTFHMQIEEADSTEAILQAGQHIGHVHASASHRGLLGRDQVDWLGVLGALQEVGYTGDIVIESFSKDNTVIARAASIWRDLYESPEQLAVEGLAFLRSNWEVLERQKESVVNA
jgi:D-psicose/D-tagatose/L-ribulose 3-epimerase